MRDLRQRNHHYDSQGPRYNESRRNDIESDYHDNSKLNEQLRTLTDVVSDLQMRMDAQSQQNIFHHNLLAANNKLEVTRQQRSHADELFRWRYLPD